MPLIVSPAVRSKLAHKQPPVTQEEILECFGTRTRGYLEDTREDHKSDPPTLWFIAETYRGRKLKVVFIMRGKDIHIRTSYPPNEDEIRIYNKRS
jgi:hypothetical protein